MANANEYTPPMNSSGNPKKRRVVKYLIGGIITLICLVVVFIIYIVSSVILAPLNYERDLKDEISTLDMPLGTQTSYRYEPNSNCLDVCPDAKYTYTLDDTESESQVYGEVTNILPTNGYTNIKASDTLGNTLVSADKNQGSKHFHIQISSSGANESVSNLIQVDISL